MGKRLEEGTPPTHVDWTSPSHTNYPDRPWVHHSRVKAEVDPKD